MTLDRDAGDGATDVVHMLELEGADGTCLVKANRRVDTRRTGNIPGVEPPAPSMAEARLAESYPPTATLEIDGVPRWLMLGTFSWDDTHFDMPGIMTSDMPVRIAAPATGTLRLGLADSPQRLTLQVVPVGRWMAAGSGEGWAAWPPSAGRRRPLPLASEQEIRLGVGNGLYVLRSRLVLPAARAGHERS